MVKVVMLCGYPMNKIYGGVAMHVHQLTHHLSKINDIELHIISFSDNANVIREDNMTIHLIKRRKVYYIPLFSPVVFWLLKRKVIEISPDLIHVQGTTSLPYLSVALYLKKKIPTLVTVHGVASKEFKFERGFAFIQAVVVSIPIERYVISKIRHLIVCSQDVEQLISNATNSKIHVIPNGVDFKMTNNIRRSEALENPCILFVGMLERVKGADILIKSIPKIIDKINDAHFYFLGDGSQLNYLKKLVNKLNIEKYVTFLGYVHGTEKYIYYKSADLCILPSRYDSAPIGLLEAMAFGKPVVASKTGGIPYVLEDGRTGLLFELGDVDDLADKVIDLLQDNHLREEMGKAAKRKAEDYAWSKVAKITLDLYHEIIENDLNGSFNCNTHI